MNLPQGQIPDIRINDLQGLGIPIQAPQLASRFLIQQISGCRLAKAPLWTNPVDASLTNRFSSPG
jgi:hypothetical protein